MFHAGHSLCCKQDICCVPITNNAHATFGLIQPIVPGLDRIILRFAPITLIHHGPYDPRTLVQERNGPNPPKTSKNGQKTLKIRKNLKISETRKNSFFFQMRDYPPPILHIWCAARPRRGRRRRRGRRGRRRKKKTFFFRFANTVVRGLHGT